MTGAAEPIKYAFAYNHAFGLEFTTTTVCEDSEDEDFESDLVYVDQGALLDALIDQVGRDEEGFGFTIEMPCKERDGSTVKRLVRVEWNKGYVQRTASVL